MERKTCWHFGPYALLISCIISRKNAQLSFATIKLHDTIPCSFIDVEIHIFTPLISKINCSLNAFYSRANSKLRVGSLPPDNRQKCSAIGTQHLRFFPLVGIKTELHTPNNHKIQSLIQPLLILELLKTLAIFPALPSFIMSPFNSRKGEKLYGDIF